jgi:hypothetical protein
MMILMMTWDSLRPFLVTHLLHLHMQMLRILAHDAKGGEEEYVRFRGSL